MNSGLKILVIGKREAEKMFRLTKIQEDFLPAIEWLIDDSINSRASGRTTLMAYAFLNKAIREKGRWIKVFDHYATPKGYIVSGIKKILIETGNKYKVKFRDNEFLIEDEKQES